MAWVELGTTAFIGKTFVLYGFNVAIEVIANTNFYPFFRFRKFQKPVNVKNVLFKPQSRLYYGVRSENVQTYSLRTFQWNVFFFSDGQRERSVTRAFGNSHNVKIRCRKLKCTAATKLLIIIEKNIDCWKIESFNQQLNKLFISIRLEEILTINLIIRRFFFIIPLRIFHPNIFQNSTFEDIQTYYTRIGIRALDNCWFLPYLQNEWKKYPWIFVLNTAFERENCSGNLVRHLKRSLYIK